MYFGKEKLIDFSIDKLCIIGEFKCTDFFYKCYDYLMDLEISKRLDISNSFYMYSFIVDDLGFIQFNKEGSDKTTFRCEYNPNKITDNGKIILNNLLSLLKNSYYKDGVYYDYLHFSRLDLAIDVYNYNIKSYTIVDVGSRKKSYFFDRENNLETLYIGSQSSSKMVRIYNKAVEQGVQNKINDWWRFEVQLRDTYINKYLSDTAYCFKNIYVFQYNITSESDLFENLIIEGLLHDMNKLSYMHPNTRTKYRKKIRNLELLSLDFFDSRLSAGLKDVEFYLNSISNDLKVL